MKTVKNNTQDDAKSLARSTNENLAIVNATLFNCLFKEAIREIDVSDAGNGTGYFDSLVDLKLDKHERLYKFTDEKGRRGLVYQPFDYLSLYEGNNVVIFERYSTSNNMLILQNETTGDSYKIYRHLCEWAEKISYVAG